MAVWPSALNFKSLLKRTISSLFPTALVPASTFASTTIRTEPISTFLHWSKGVPWWSRGLLMVCACLACGLGYHSWSKSNRHSLKSRESKENWKANGTHILEDPPLIKKHSTIKAYTTSSFTYPAVRTFLHLHPQSAKLPTESKPLPLFVFIHGLGGSIAQFNLLLGTLVNVGPCLAIDLPGCGLSDLFPRDWDAYTHEALTELLDVAVQQACHVLQTKEVIFVGHSMGCSFSVSLTLSSKRQNSETYVVKGIIAICPRVSAIPADQVTAFRRLLSVPSSIFNLWRLWDARGGVESGSVTRFVGKEASPDTKKLQLSYNQQSRTETFRRIARGALPLDDLQKGLPGPQEWSRLDVSILAVAGASDVVTLPSEIAILFQAINGDRIENCEHPIGPTLSAQSVESEPAPLAHNTTPTFKTTILPAPASHGLIYDLATYRTLSGLIQDFVANYVDHRLSLGWQLQCLKDSNKWDVKNLEKWQAVLPVSKPIAGVFYALKTLREVDEVHSPRMFARNWSSKIKAIIDISHESPVYDPQGLKQGDIAYYKIPTISKIPPTVDEVRDFSAMVDRLRGEDADNKATQQRRLIGVHCHYGFNRTGFFICAYLIERLGYSVQAAVDEFQERRPPGIRHEHFLDALFLRYCAGTK